MKTHYKKFEHSARTACRQQARYLPHTTNPEEVDCKRCLKALGKQTTEAASTVRKVHWQERPSAKISHCGQHFDKCYWSPVKEAVTCKKCLTYIRKINTGMVPDPRHVPDPAKDYVQGKTKKKKKEKIRLNMDVEPKTRERLDRLQDMIEATSYAEVIRRALIHYEFHMKKFYGPGRS